MNTTDQMVKAVPPAALEGAVCDRRHSRHWPPALAITMACLLLTGCQTFNYTDDDLAREREKLAAGWASGSWRNWGCGASGFKVSPNLGSIGCPAIGAGAVCPGK